MKKIQNSKNNQLNEGESVVGVLQTNVIGATAAVSTQAAGGLLGMFIGNKMKKSATGKVADKQISSQLADSLPDALNWIAVTDHDRVLVYSASALSGKINEVVCEMKKSDVTVSEWYKGKLTHSVTLKFSDGGQKVVEAPKLNNVEDFKIALS